VSPVEPPSTDDLDFFRKKLPELLKSKNISFHPESGRVRGLDSEDATVTERVNRVLVSVSDGIENFLSAAISSLSENWTAGTCSFCPIQEKGRDLKPHASNELVHIDAGASGATNGDRILRFFINVNPDDDRVLTTKRKFPQLYSRFAEAANIKPAHASGTYLQKGALDHLGTMPLSGLEPAIRSFSGAKKSASVSL
jgi:hypothetical protein